MLRDAVKNFDCLVDMVYLVDLVCLVGLVYLVYPGGLGDQISMFCPFIPDF